jgi:hypothetical protein
MNDVDLAVQLAAAELVVACVQKFPEKYSRCVEYAVENLKKVNI